MGISPSVLYSHLLSDLSDYLNPDQIALVQKGLDLWPDITQRQAAASSLLRSVFKKFEYPNSQERDAKALTKFLQCDLQCKSWVLQLNTSHDEELVGELRSAIWNFWNDSGMPIVSSDSQCLEEGTVGPGAAVGSVGGDFYTKMFSSELSCTSRYLSKCYKCFAQAWPEWSNAEITRELDFGSPRIVEGNRLSFVPKNDDISRTICIEPVLNMYFQLGLGHILERRLLAHVGINMATQPFKNRELARVGSIDDSLSTIDLSSASDSISLRMLEYFLPHDMFALVKRLRSPIVDIPGKGPHELNMVSTMGNGFTFPLQTMLFTCIVLACFKVNAHRIMPHYPRGRSNGNFAVFGDDIIVPREITRDVLRLLELTGFTVNGAKTFVEGPFRESCGEDYYLGLNIRGVYIKRLDTPQARYSVINQLNLFSTRTGIVLRATVGLLLSSVRFYPVPFGDNDDSGIKMPLSFTGSNVMYSKENGSVLYRHFRAIGRKIRILENGIWVPRFAKPRIFNPSGLHISFLQRSVNSHSIGIRHNPPRYERKLGVCPNWDYIPTFRPIAGRSCWERWKTAIYFNFN